ncbi:MAG: DUF535 family protein [Chlorobiaceae bacterium]|nr:DUF535 family protein [Chlorobiaceae bacterium]
MLHSSLKAGRTAWILSNSIYKSSGAGLRSKNKIRWALIAAISPSESLDWFNRLDIKEMRSFSERIPYLTFKPMRVFMSTRWNIAQRKKVIEDTYHFIRTYKGALQEAILNAGGSTLARFNLEGYGEVSVILCYDNSLRKEGALMVSLKCASLHEPVIQIAFSLEERSATNRVCYIGCIQGRSSKDEMKAITKAMHGLRPHVVMLFIVQEIMSALGMTHLFGVGNTIHPHHQKYLIHLPFVHETTFDYDSLWKELGGLSDQDGWFKLPLKSERRADKEMKSNKRAMYHRRYAMMDNLTTQISESIVKKSNDVQSSIPPGENLTVNIL